MKERPILFSAPMVRAILEDRKGQTRRVVKPQPQPFAGGVHPSNTAKHPAPYIDAYCGERKTEANPRGMGTYWCWWTEDDREGPGIGRCPFGQPGDRLWVRETFKSIASGEVKNGYGEVRYGFAYQADGATLWRSQPTVIHDLTGQPPTGPMQFKPVPWKPSIHMPRRASRITLEVTGVRVERLQNISEADARAEGVEKMTSFNGYRNYKSGSACIGFAGANDSFYSLWESINGPGSWDANPWVWVVEFRRLP